MSVNLAPPVIEDTLVRLGWLQIQARQAQPVLLQRFLVLRVLLGASVLLQPCLDRRV